MKQIQLILCGVLWVVSSGGAQTLLDFRNQINPTTSPVRSGSALPSTCSAGTLFLKTDTATLHACIATNTWALQNSGGGGTLNIQSDGSIIGSRATVNFVSGTGILKALSDNGSRIDVANLADTAILQTRDNYQSGHDLFCDSASGSSTSFTCTITDAHLAMYTRGMVMYWRPDRDVAGPVTLSIDGRGPVSVKDADGSTDLAYLRAGTLSQLWYDGSVFRILTPVSVVTTTAPNRPSCSTAAQGRLWFIVGAQGSKDELAVCAKSALGDLQWRVLY